MLTNLWLQELSHIISVKGLKKMYKYFNKKIDSEMIEPFVKRKIKNKDYNFDKFNLNKKIRLTLDYQEDLKLINIVK